MSNKELLCLMASNIAPPQHRDDHKSAASFSVNRAIEILRWVEKREPPYASEPPAPPSNHEREACKLIAARAAEQAEHVDGDRMYRNGYHAASLEIYQRICFRGQPDYVCSDCQKAAGEQHKPSCHRQGIVSQDSDYRDRRPTNA